MVFSQCRSYLPLVKASSNDSAVYTAFLPASQQYDTNGFSGSSAGIYAAFLLKRRRPSSTENLASVSGSPSAFQIGVQRSRVKSLRAEEGEPGTEAKFSVELGRRRLSKNAAYIPALEPLKPLVSLV